MTASPPLIYQFFACTDPGRVRTNNEDAVCVDQQAQVAVLADGMGGYNAGEVASGMATTFIQAELSRWIDQAGQNLKAQDLRRAMEICVDNANQAILGAAESNPQYMGMGTTLVVGVFQGSRLMLGHIGDSRCYRLRSGALDQLTRDHSWLQEQIDAGLLTPQQAALSSCRNLVTRALGVEEEVHAEINEFRVEPQDLYLMCSDGLSEMLSHQELTALVAAPTPLQDKAAQLISAANAQGGRDNIAIVLVQATAEPQKRGLMARLLRST